VPAPRGWKPGLELAGWSLVAKNAAAGRGM